MWQWKLNRWELVRLYLWRWRPKNKSSVIKVRRLLLLTCNYVYVWLANHISHHINHCRDQVLLLNSPLWLNGSDHVDVVVVRAHWEWIMWSMHNQKGHRSSKNISDPCSTYMIIDRSIYQIDQVHALLLIESIDRYQIDHDSRSLGDRTPLNHSSLAPGSHMRFPVWFPCESHFSHWVLKLLIHQFNVDSPACKRKV